MRPTFTTGDAAANVITTAICRNTRKKSRILLAPCSAKLSEQSPPCRRKASPAATRASAFFRLRASPAKTSGGNVASCASTSANALASGYSGICSTGLARQLSGVHRSDMTLTPEQKPLLMGEVANGRVIHRLATDRQLEFRPISQALAAKAEFHGSRRPDRFGDVRSSALRPEIFAAGRSAPSSQKACR